MHASSRPLSSLRPTGRRLRVALVAFAATVCASISLAAAAPAPASADGPVTMEPWAEVVFRSWAWGPTTLCVYNEGDVRADVLVDPYGPGIELMYVGSKRERCISRWWFGNLVEVGNGSTRVTAWTY
jgi:hypothetical protein